MKNRISYRNVFASLFIVALVAIVLFACNKEIEKSANNNDAELVVESSNCVFCNSQFYEPTASQRKAFHEVFNQNKK